MNDIDSFYYKNYNKLPDETKHHFLSRMYLWFKSDQYKKALDGSKLEYIGADQDARLSILKELYKYTPSPYLRQKEQREKYLDIYKEVIVHNRVLAKNLFSKTLYDCDISKIVRKVIDFKSLKSFYSNLEKERQAIATLATTVVNLSYFLKFYFNQQPDLEFELLSNKFFLDIFHSEYNFQEDWEVEIAIYLLTHIIIGESYFYNVAPKRSDVNSQVLKELENLIKENYANVSLDNKLEYLVCCRLMSEESKLYEKILSEAQKNIVDNSYVIDIYNLHLSSAKDPFSKLTEHTNTLYIMATNSFAHNEKQSLEQ